ncbi:MAG: 3-phosphoglycerate kinase [Candidatus Omnitrophota bacterium]|jgi:3-phosphoglycerate kinase
MKQSIRDLDLKDKKVLIRVDFNVPLNEALEITNDNRIQASLPTIQFALEKGAQVILMSHLGRPKGKVNASMSLAPVAKHLKGLLNREVVMCSDCVGEAVVAEVNGASKDAVVLLENLRFHSEEEANDPDFAKSLAALGDVFVNDAFGTSHRAHASVAGIAEHLNSAAGFLLEKEVKFLGDATRDAKKPFVLILGGSKVSDKICLIENMISKVDKIIIGGAMAYTFMKVQGKSVGMSRVEEDRLVTAQDILDKAKAANVEILLPDDNLCIQEFKNDAPSKICENGMDDGYEGVDIGPKTMAKFTQALEGAQTIVWNGPMGVFEMSNFAKGSRAIADKLATLNDAVTVIGGGDTAACVIQFGLDSQMTHISTGGGASLEYLEGKELPGITAIPETTKV